VARLRVWEKPRRKWIDCLMAEEEWGLTEQSSIRIRRRGRNRNGFRLCISGLGRLDPAKIPEDEIS
jgi:hypothetical protein